MGSTILTEIVTLLTGALTSLGSAIGSALSGLTKSVFLEEVTSGGTTTTQLSTFGVVIVVFGAISLAFGVSRLVVSWISSFGGKRV